MKLDITVIVSPPRITSDEVNLRKLLSVSHCDAKTRRTSHMPAFLINILSSSMKDLLVFLLPALMPVSHALRLPRASFIPRSIPSHERRQLQ